MRRRKPLPTRSRRALRRLAVLAALLTVLNGLGIYRVTPWRGVEAIADLCDVEQPEKVCRFYDGTLPVYRFALHYLVDGEDAMMLCTTGFHPLMGWYDRDWCRVETWDGAPVHAGVVSHAQGGKRTVYLFGRVDNGYIDRFTLTFTEVTEGEGGTLERVPHSMDLPASALFRGGNDRRYLLTALDFPWVEDAPFAPQFEDFRILGYDHADNVLADEEVFWRSWSSGR